MSESKLVASIGLVDEMWGSAIKESGFRYIHYENCDQAVEEQPDYLLFDARPAESVERMGSLKSRYEGSIISLIEDGVNRSELLKLKEKGSHDYVIQNTPPEELVLRLKAMASILENKPDGESRSSSRVWFQQKVKFNIFDKEHESWSTTLSETGIFLRSPLSFPLYSVMHLSFTLWGESDPFDCDGVIVRQEVESEVKGLGVMFQNLKGDSIRRLESFLDIYR